MRVQRLSVDSDPQRVERRMAGVAKWMPAENQVSITKRHASKPGVRVTQQLEGAEKEVRKPTFAADVTDIAYVTKRLAGIESPERIGKRDNG